MEKLLNDSIRVEVYPAMEGGIRFVVKDETKERVEQSSAQIFKLIQEAGGIPNRPIRNKTDKTHRYSILLDNGDWRDREILEKLKFSPEEIEKVYKENYYM